MAEPFIGEIRMVGFNFPPRGWALCDHQLLPINQNTALFSLLGTTFGGDGRTTFGLPGLRGRTPVHVGTGAGLDPVAWGQSGGQNFHTLTVGEMPNHTHTASLHQENVPGDKGNGEGRMLANSAANPIYTDLDPASDRTLNAASIRVAAAGGSRAHNNMQPYLGIYHCIALQGIFPSRN